MLMEAITIMTLVKKNRLDFDSNNRNNIFYLFCHLSPDK